jgi:hypothetical protein
MIQYMLCTCEINTRRNIEILAIFAYLVRGGGDIFVE